MWYSWPLCIILAAGLCKQECLPVGFDALGCIIQNPTFFYCEHGPSCVTPPLLHPYCEYHKGHNSYHVVGWLRFYALSGKPSSITPERRNIYDCEVWMGEVARVLERKILYVWVAPSLWLMTLLSQHCQRTRYVRIRVDKQLPLTINDWTMCVCEKSLSVLYPDLTRVVPWWTRLKLSGFIRVLCYKIIGELMVPPSHPQNEPKN